MAVLEICEVDALPVVNVHAVHQQPNSEVVTGECAAGGAVDVHFDHVGGARDGHSEDAALERDFFQRPVVHQQQHLEHTIPHSL